MSSFQNKSFLQSTPFKIIWAAFESDTLRLQNNGWTLAIEDRFDHPLYRHELRFILRHEMLDLYCITGINIFDFHDLTSFINHHGSFLPFHIQALGKEIHYRNPQRFDLTCIKEIDAIPQYMDVDYGKISELSIFKTLIKPDNALIVEPDQIALLLEKIVSAQSPKQAEIRERIRKSDARDNLKQTLHAQILSVA